MQKGYIVDASYVENVLNRNKNKNGKKWTVDEIVNLITDSDAFVINSLIILHSYQTKEEQDSESTGEQNGVGFNQFDAGPLTDIYNKMVKYGKITTGQIDYVRKKLIKYRNQLTRIANFEV